MLKIKDNINLKELEKYGFIERQYKTWEDKMVFRMVKHLDCGDTYVEVTCVCRHLIINLDYDKELLTKDLDVIYDLINDGLVEKVEE